MASATDPDREVRHKLQVHFDVHQCQPTQDELNALADDADSLAVQVGNFPQADLRVLIERGNRNNEYAVKLSLLLPGETIACSEHDAVLATAFERALAAVEANAKAYKDRLGQVAERQKHEKGTHQELRTATPVDASAVDAAITAGDFTAFRAALLDYEEGLRGRIGRWVERYPAVAGRIGKGIEIADLVDDVYLTAFEGYASRPTESRFGDWLESLIDPTVKAFQNHSDEELENVRMARSAADAEKRS